MDLSEMSEWNADRSVTLANSGVQVVELPGFQLSPE